MSKVKKVSFRADFRRSILTGLGTLLPLMLTIFLIWQCWILLDRKIGTPINDALKQQLQTETGKRVLARWFGYSDRDVANEEVLRRKLEKDFPNYLGLAIAILIAILVMYTVGYLVATYFGRKFFRTTERFLGRFPVIKVVYPYAKQVTEFLFSKKKRTTFSRVVAIEYPRRGVYSLAFVTGDGLKEISDTGRKKYINVFVPSSPTPVTGFVIFVPADEVVPLSMTVDEAFRMLVSGGVLLPPREVRSVSVDSDTQMLMAYRDDEGSPGPK